MAVEASVFRLCVGAAGGNQDAQNQKDKWKKPKHSFPSITFSAIFGNSGKTKCPTLRGIRCWLITLKDTRTQSSQ